MGWKQLVSAVSAWSLWTSICIQPQQSQCYSSLSCRLSTAQDQRIYSSPVNRCCMVCSLPLDSSAPSLLCCPWCDIWKNIASHWQNSSKCYSISRWELLQWPVEAWADFGHQEIPASQWSLKGTVLLREREKRKGKALDLQSDLPEKGVAEDYRRNAVFLIIKTNASFLKDIINKPSTFALLSRKKKGWGLGWASHFICFFSIHPWETSAAPTSQQHPGLPWQCILQQSWVAAPAMQLPVGKIWAWQALKWKGSHVSVEQCYLNSDVWETSPGASLNTFWCFIQTNDVQGHHTF